MAEAWRHPEAGSWFLEGGRRHPGETVDGAPNLSPHVARVIAIPDLADHGGEAAPIAAGCASHLLSRSLRLRLGGALRSHADDAAVYEGQVQTTRSDGHAIKYGGSVERTAGQ